MWGMNKDMAQGMTWLVPGLAAVPRLSADFLALVLGNSWADNPRDLPDTRHWVSEFNGTCLKGLMSLSHQQAECFAPLGVPAEMFNWWLKPLVQATRDAVAAGRDPDLVALDDLRVEAAYAEQLQLLVRACTVEEPATAEEIASAAVNIDRDGRKLVFSRTFCDWACGQWAGQVWLLSQLSTLQQLEWQYHSFGPTRLGALKNLLRSLLQVIAGQVFSHADQQPYRKAQADGSWRETDEKYLADCELRLLALLARDAFDVRRFALESPNARLGACQWEEVPDSALYSVRLRHYPLPQGVQPNGKTLYMSSPMINRCEIFDLAPGKSVIEGMLALGYDLYMVDYGNPGPDQHDLGLDFYGYTVHDRYLDLLQQRHPGQLIEVMAYCMGGTLVVPYLARRFEEEKLAGHECLVRQVVLLTTPMLFDDEASGHKPMRDLIRRDYQPAVMETFFGGCNVPPQTIELGMHGIQPGVAFSVAEGFYARASFPAAIDDAAPFLHWLHSGTRFPARAHREWISRIVMGNQIWEDCYCLPSKFAELDGKPVDMTALNDAHLSIFDYRGLRDPIAPPGSCKTSERWGLLPENVQMVRGGLNRTIEKNIGHIFVVSKVLLGEFMQAVREFLHDEPPAAPPRNPAAAPTEAAPAEAEAAQEATAPVEVIADVVEAAPVAVEAVTVAVEPAPAAEAFELVAQVAADVPVEVAAAEPLAAAPAAAVAEVAAAPAVVEAVAPAAEPAPAPAKAPRTRKATSSTSKPRTPRTRKQPPKAE